MTGSLLLLVVCYALLAMLVLALCLYTRWSFWIKSGAIVAVTVFYVFTYESMMAILGFPVAAQPPGRFLFHYAVVVQPNKTNGDKGAIYLWATEIGKDGPVREPRAYELPWEKDAAAMVTESQRRARQGIVQLGTSTEIGTREGVSSVTRYLTSNVTKRIKLQDMPDPSLPEK